MTRASRGRRGTIAAPVTARGRLAEVAGADDTIDPNDAFAEAGRRQARLRRRRIKELP